jgi:teichuronic acid exporter
MSLGKKTRSAFVWSAIDLIGGKTFVVISQVIMARILNPSDFGIFAILMVFVNFSNALIEGGMGQALIQKKKATQSDYTTVFYFMIGVSLLVYLAFWILAPFIADFYGNTGLITMGRFISIVFIVNALGSVPMTILIKNLDFKSIAVRNFIVCCISGISGILMAYFGMGVWSLIYMLLLQNILNALVIWPLTSWRPTFLFSLSSLKELFGYGSKLAFSTILNTSFEEMNKVVVGRLFGMGELGLYRKSVEIRDLVSSKINSVFTRILFPAFSYLQDDLKNLNKQVSIAIQAQSFVSFPLLIFMIFFTEEIVLVLLTDKWLPMAPYLKLLAVIHFVSPINTNSKNIMKVLGRSDYFLITEVIRKVLYVTSIIISYRFGVIGLIIGLIVVSFIGMFVNLYYSNKQSGFSYFSQIKDSFLFLIIGLVAVFIPWLYKDEIQMMLFFKLILAALLFCVFYLTLTYFSKVQLVDYIKINLTKRRHET